MADTATWLGHEFTVYKIDGIWSKDCGGVYIFCGVNQQNQWVALYVGLCECFCDRLTNHDRWEEAVALGATHVHARAEKLEATRASLEEQLIQAYQPPLNTHHR